MTNDIHDGGCVCGQVRFRTRGPLASVIACHCRECRRMSGHFYAATAVPRERLQMLTEESLAWYQSSPTSKRGFCSNCGSSLFFDHADSDVIGIAAGAFDGDPPLGLAVHIYTNEAGHYYGLPDGEPQMDAEAWSNGGWEQYRGK